MQGKATGNDQKTDIDLKALIASQFVSCYKLDGSEPTTAVTGKQPAFAGQSENNSGQTTPNARGHWSLKMASCSRAPIARGEHHQRAQCVSIARAPPIQQPIDALIRRQPDMFFIATDALFWNRSDKIT